MKNYMIFKIRNLIFTDFNDVIGYLSNEDEVHIEVYEREWNDCWGKAGTFSFIRDKEDK